MLTRANNADIRSSMKDQPGGYVGLDDKGRTQVPVNHVVLRSPNGTDYRIVVDNTGALSTVPA